VLEFTILGLLKERPMHGYDLRKRMREEFGALENLSFGSLYPALGRLEASHDIRTVTGLDGAHGAPVPFTGSLGGERAATVARRAAAAIGGRGTRARKIYEITESGEALFDRLLDSAEEKEDPRNFLLRLAFARHLSGAARVRLLERHAFELNRRLVRSNAALTSPVRPLDEYQRAIAEHAREGILADLAWVESLLEQERAAMRPAIDTPVPVAAGTGTRNDGRKA
jgi:DNA-binding PadR family transcriptional regulator